MKIEDLVSVSPFEDVLIAEEDDVSGAKLYEGELQKCPEILYKRPIKEMHSYLVIHAENVFSTSTAVVVLA